MSRVAVQLGAAWLRVAVADPRPRLLAVVPVRDADPSGVLRNTLSALLDRPADELLVVHARAALPAVLAMVPPRAGTAVRAVPSSVAALGGAPARAGAPPATGPSAWNATADEPAWLDGLLDAVVVDVGQSGTEITRLSGGRIMAVCRLGVGGAILDDVTAGLLGGEAVPRSADGLGDRRASRVEVRSGRRVVPRADPQAAREALSLQPVVQVGVPPVELQADALRHMLIPHLAAVVDGVRAVRAGVGPGRPPPVLLVGGVARTPLLAELLDAAGVADVRVAARPDSAAVVGALRLPPELLGPPLLLCPPASAARSARHRSARHGAPGCPPVAREGARPGAASPSAPELARAGSAPAAFWLPPVHPERRPLRGLAVAATVAAALAVLYAAGAVLPAPDPSPLAAAGELVQYGYAIRLPAGWAHTGGLPERRRSLLTPAGTPDGGNMISVERTPLGYDADAEPQRARAELRAEFTRAVASGAALSGFDDDARFAGRPVVAYRETGGGAARDADAARVDWYVVLDGDAQLSVGCRHTTAGAKAVATACATVVGSLHRTA